MNEPKFAVGDIVSTISGYTSNCNSDKYAGGGYKPNSTFKVSNVESGKGMWKGTWIYWCEDDNIPIKFGLNYYGIAEFALSNISIIRNKKLEELLEN